MEEVEDGPAGASRGLTRRAALRNGSAAAVAVMLAGPGSALGDVAVAVRPGKPGYLDPERMSALRGLVDAFIPGRSEDSVGGALAGGCAEAIDALLAAFEYRPPRIYAGAPFSDRAGSRVNHFKRFIRLDAYEEKAWRLRVQGSRGRRKLEFNGPVKGWQEIYGEGLAALNAAADGSFEGASPAEREAILREGGGPIGELVDVAFPHTYQFMYGAPEYRGNRDLLGWRYTNYDGDVHPRGWSRAEIEQLASPSEQLGEGALRHRLHSAGVAPEALLAVAGIGSQDAGHGIVMRSGGSLSAMRAEIQPIVEWAARGGLDGGA